MAVPVRRQSQSIFNFRPLRRNALFCSQKSPKNHKNQYFQGSRSFKVIDVDISKKLLASARYDKQHISAYLQPVSRQTCQQRQNNVFFGEVTSCPSFVETPFTQLHDISCCHEILEPQSYHTVKSRSLCLTWSWNGTGMTDRQRELPQLIRAIASQLALARKN